MCDRILASIFTLCAGQCAGQLIIADKFHIRIGECRIIGAIDLFCIVRSNGQGLLANCKCSRLAFSTLVIIRRCDRCLNSVSAGISRSLFQSRFTLIVGVGHSAVSGVAGHGRRIRCIAVGPARDGNFRRELCLGNIDSLAADNGLVVRCGDTVINRMLTRIRKFRRCRLVCLNKACTVKLLIREVYLCAFHRCGNGNAVLLAIVGAFIAVRLDLEISILRIYHILIVELCVKRHSAFQNSVVCDFFTARRLGKPANKLIAFSYGIRQQSGRLVVCGQSQRCCIRCSEIRLCIEYNGLFRGTQRYRSGFSRQLRQYLVELHILLTGQRQSLIGQVNGGQNCAVSVQNIRRDRAEICIQHRIIGDVCVDSVIPVIACDKRRIHCCLALVLRQQTIDCHIGIVVHGVELIGIIHPCACINADTAVRDLLCAANEIRYVDRLDKGVNITINILICRRVNGDRFADLLSMCHILIERQFHSLAAVCQRDIGRIAQCEPNVSCLAALSYDLHAGNADVRTVEDERAGRLAAAVCCQGIIHITNYLGNSIIRCDHSRLTGQEIQTLKFGRLTADLRLHIVHLAGSGVSDRELYRKLQTGHQVTQIRVGSDLDRALVKGAACQLHTCSRLVRQNCQILRGSCVIDCIDWQFRHINGIVYIQVAGIAVIAADQNGSDLVIGVGVGIKAVNGVILGSLCDDCRCRDADHTVLLKEANCIQLLLVRVLCLVAFLLLRPYDGELAQIRVADRSREMEVGADLGRCCAADALREVCIDTAVCIDACQTDIVADNCLIGIAFLTCFMLGVPAHDELIADCRYLCIGVGVAVIRQATCCNNLTRRIDKRVECLGACDVIICADTVNEKRCAVRQHCGVNCIDSASRAVVGNLCLHPLSAVKDAVVDRVLHVEHCCDVLIAAILRHRRCIQAAPCDNRLITAAGNGRCHICIGVICQSINSPFAANIGTAVDLGSIQHHAEVIIGRAVVHFLFRRIHLLYPCSKCIAAGSACHNIGVGKDIALRSIYCALDVVAVAALDCIADNALQLICIVIIRDKQHDAAVVGQNRIRVRISIFLQHRHAISGSCQMLRGIPLLYPFQIVAVLDLVAAVNVDQRSTVGQQLHRI